MDTISKWKDLTLDSLGAMGQGIADILPNIVGAIFALVVGWLVTKIVLFLLKRVLRLTRIDKLTEKINETDLFGKTDIKFNISEVILGFVKWILFLVFLIIASDIMNWNIVSVEIGNLLRYLPKLFSAIALFMIGLYIANFIKKAISGLFESMDLSGSKIISRLVFYIILIIITVTALNQAGIDTSIITNNVTIILGAFLLAAAIGFGLGSKVIVADLLRTFYARKNYEVGDKITIDGLDGVIVSIDNLSITLWTSKGKTILPIKDFMSLKVDVAS